MKIRFRHALTESRSLVFNPAGREKKLPSAFDGVKRRKVPSVVQMLRQHYADLRFAGDQGIKGNSRDEFVSKVRGMVQDTEVRAHKVRLVHMINGASLAGWFDRDDGKLTVEAHTGPNRGRVVP